MTAGRDVLDLLPDVARQAANEAQVRAPLPLTDLGNAERLVAACGGRIRYCPPRRRWLLWDGRRWAWDERGDVTRLAKGVVRTIYAEATACDHEESRKAVAAHARRSERASALAAMIKLTETEAGVPVMPRELDAHAWLLNCPNGTLDLQTGALRPHSPADLITKITPVPYVGEMRSELWDRVLATTVGNDQDLADYLCRVAGYALSGAATERAFFFLYGPPGTAKSTFLDALRGAMGEYAIAASSDTFLVQSNTGGNRGDLVRLAGARLVTCSEMRPGARWDEALIKQITGGDPIVASAKYEAEVEFKPSFAFTVAANDAPRLRDDDAGMWARMRRIPLTAQIAPELQDRNLKSRLQSPEHEHAAAILAWAVRGCRQWQNQGLGSCDAVALSTAQYRDEMDVFARFLDECCVLEPDAHVSKAELNRRYRVWCRDTGVRYPLSNREITARLELRGCGQRVVHGDRQWKGIRMLYADEEQDAG